MNCEKIYERLQDFLDRELTAAEIEEVKTHISHCPPCGDEFRFEESVLRHVKRCMGDAPCPEELLKRIAAAIDRECQGS